MRDDTPTPGADWRGSEIVGHAETAPNISQPLQKFQEAALRGSPDPCRSALPVWASTTVRQTEEQRHAALRMLRAISSSEDLYVGGVAGVGKTKVLADVARQTPSALLVTPTGKAAHGLSRKTGLLATTIHGAIYGAPVEWEDEAGKVHLEWRGKIEPGSLDGRTFLLDEASMVGVELLRDMRETGANIVAVGDYGQLPPVEDRPAFVTPDITLRQIHRQALESPIIRQAHAVRAGGRCEPDGDDFRVIQAASDEDLFNADVVLTHRNATRDKMNAQIRRILGFNSQYPLRGEPVVCLINSPLNGVFNGAVYTVLRDLKEGDRRICIDGANGPQEIPAIFLQTYGPRCRHPRTYLPLIAFAYGYALTVHKAQGSEFDAVVLIDENEKYDRIRWLYTGLTRAVDTVTVVRGRP